MHAEPGPEEPIWINRFLLAAAALACMAALAALWSGHQQGAHRHQKLIADITVNLGGRPVREHCTTCHPGGSRPISIDTGQAHPEISPHSPEKLGCTGCHLGEGMALDETISHGLPGLGARSVLTGKGLQASCYTCHELQPLAGAEQAWKGYRLFIDKACDTCHHVAGLGRGGRYGPDLSAVGSHLGLAQLEEATREPKLAPANSIMPRFPLSRGQAAQIGYFLKSRVRTPFYATPMEIRAGRVSLPALPVAAGESPLQRQRCLACHSFRDEDGRIAPDLTWIAALRPPPYLETFLTAPARLIPGAIMPEIPMSPAERKELFSYLLAEAAGPFGEADGAAGPGAPPEVTAKNRYMALCRRCHAASGDGFGPIQPNLANFPRAFAGNAEFFRRSSDERLVRSLADGVAGTSMPPFGRLLDAQGRERLLDLLFSAFVGVPRHDKATLPPLPARPSTLPEEMGEDLYAKRCSRCHGIAGTGTGPEHLRYLPRPRNLTNRPYFSTLADERIAQAIRDGIPGTAMPPFGDSGLWALVQEVRALSGAPP